MKRLTGEFFSKIIDETFLEYTKNRFISGEEVEDFTKCFTAVLDTKVKTEQLRDAEIVIIFDNII